MAGDAVTRQAVFLRGINVGGHAVLSMDRLREIVERLGFEQVRTVRATGNLLIESRAGGKTRDADRIRAALSKELGRPIQVALRSQRALEELVAAEPFRPERGEPWTPYVTFLAAVPRLSPRLPIRSAPGHIEVFERHALDVLSWCRREGSSPGFPNDLVEKGFGVPATTRNWSTVVALGKLTAADR